MQRARKVSRDDLIWEIATWRLRKARDNVNPEKHAHSLVQLILPWQCKKNWESSENIEGRSFGAELKLSAEAIQSLHRRWLTHGKSRPPLCNTTKLSRNLTLHSEQWSTRRIQVSIFNFWTWFLISTYRETQNL